MSTNEGQAVLSIYEEIDKRVRNARRSESRMVDPDTLVGPVAGRSVNARFVKDLVQKIQTTSGFDELHALLVVEEEHQLYVVGGSHRLQVVVGVIPVPLVPVKIINLSDMPQLSGVKVSIQNHAGVIVGCVQGTESHAQPYSAMQEVMLFNDVICDFHKYFDDQLEKMHSQGLKIPNFKKNSSNLLEYYNRCCGKSIELIANEKNKSERMKVVRGMEMFQMLERNDLKDLEDYAIRKYFSLTAGQVKAISKMSMEDLRRIVNHIRVEVRKDLDGMGGEDWKPFTKKTLERLDPVRREKKIRPEAAHNSSKSVGATQDLTAAPVPKAHSLLRSSFVRPRGNSSPTRQSKGELDTARRTREGKDWKHGVVDAVDDKAGVDEEPLYLSEPDSDSEEEPVKKKRRTSLKKNRARGKLKRSGIVGKSSTSPSKYGSSSIADSITDDLAPPVPGTGRTGSGHLGTPSKVGRAGISETIKEDTVAPNPLQRCSKDDSEGFDVEEEYKLLTEYGNPLPGSKYKHRSAVDRMMSSRLRPRPEIERCEGTVRLEGEGENSAAGDAGSHDTPPKVVSGTSEIGKVTPAGENETTTIFVSPAKRTASQEGSDDRTIQDVDWLTVFFEDFDESLKTKWLDRKLSASSIVKDTKKWCLSRMTEKENEIRESSTQKTRLVTEFIEYSSFCQVLEQVVCLESETLSLSRLDELWNLHCNSASVDEMKLKILGKRSSLHVNSHSIRCLKNGGVDPLCDNSMAFLFECVMSLEIKPEVATLIPSIAHGTLFSGEKEEDAAEKCIGRLPTELVKELKDSNFILIPINYSFHWILVAVVGLRDFQYGLRDNVIGYFMNSVDSTIAFQNVVKNGVEELTQGIQQFGRGENTSSNGLSFKAIELIVPKQPFSHGTVPDNSCGFRTVWHACLLCNIGAATLLKPAVFAQGWRTLQKILTFKSFMDIINDRMGYLLDLSGKGLAHFGTALFQNFAIFQVDVDQIFCSETLLHDIDLDKFTRLFLKMSSPNAALKKRKLMVESVLSSCEDIAIMVLKGSDVGTAVLQILVDSNEEKKEEVAGKRRRVSSRQK